MRPALAPKAVEVLVVVVVGQGHDAAVAEVVDGVSDR